MPDLPVRRLSPRPWNHMLTSRIARVIQEELLKDFSSRSELSDWFSRVRFSFSYAILYRVLTLSRRIVTPFLPPDRRSQIPATSPMPQSCKSSRQKYTGTAFTTYAPSRYRTNRSAPAGYKSRNQHGTRYSVRHLRLLHPPAARHCLPLTPHYSVLQNKSPCFLFSPARPPTPVLALHPSSKRRHHNSKRSRRR